MIEFIQKLFCMRSKHQIITDSLQAKITFDNLKLKGAEMIGVMPTVLPAGVFFTAYLQLFLPKKDLRDNIKLKRQFKSDFGEARHLEVRHGRRVFDIKICKRYALKADSDQEHLIYGGDRLNYYYFRIHIKMDGKRCFSGKLVGSNLVIEDDTGPQIDQISYLLLPLDWEYSLAQALKDTRRKITESQHR